MALIQCPECQSEVSTRADSCPVCGYPISEMTLEEKDAIIKEKERQEKESVLIETFEEIKSATEIVISNYKRNIRCLMTRTITFWFFVINFLSGLNFEHDNFAEDFMLFKFPISGLLAIFAAFLVADGIKEFFGKILKTICLIIGGVLGVVAYIVPIAIILLIVVLVVGGIAMSNAELVVTVLMIVVSLPALINLVLGIKELIFIIVNRRAYKEAKESMFNKAVLCED